MKKYEMNNKKSNLKCVNLLTHRNALTRIIVVLILINALFIPIFINDSFSKVVSLGMALFAILIVFERKGSMKKENINRVFYVLVFLIGVSFLINGLYFKVIGYVAISITFICLIPALNYYLTKGDCKRIYSAITDGVIIVFVIVLLISIFMGPILTSDQYSSVFGNSNILGNFNIITAAAILYKLLYKNKKRAWVILTFLFFLNVSVCIFSNSRTSMIAIDLQYIIYLCIILRTSLSNNKIKVFLKEFLVVTAIMMISFCSLFYLLSNEKIKVIEFNSTSISFRESIETSKNRFSKGLDENASVDAFTSGRIGIWNEYIRDLGIIGHKKESKDIIKPSRAYKDTNAHNVYIQVAYSAGIIAGCAYLMFAVCVFGKSVAYFLICMKNKKCDREVIYAIFVAIGFGITSLTSAGYMIFTYLPATIFWMTSGILFVERDKNE